MKLKNISNENFSFVEKNKTENQIFCKAIQYKARFLIEIETKKKIENLQKKSYLNHQYIINMVQSDVLVT